MYVMKKICTTLGLVALGVVSLGTWWVVKESLRDIKSISRDPMPEEVTQEQLEELQEKFGTRR